MFLFSLESQEYMLQLQKHAIWLKLCPVPYRHGSVDSACALWCWIGPWKASLLQYLSPYRKLPPDLSSVVSDPSAQFLIVCASQCEGGFVAEAVGGMTRSLLSLPHSFFAASGSLLLQKSLQKSVYVGIRSSWQVCYSSLGTRSTRKVLVLVGKWVCSVFL